MRDVLLTIETRGEAQAEQAWSELATQSWLCRLSNYRRLDGDSDYSNLLIAETQNPVPLKAVLNEQSDNLHRLMAFRRCFRMTRDGNGAAVNAPFDDPDREPAASILTVVLPVPQDRDVEWNRWYDEVHMPTVLGLAPAIVVGHRFRPMIDGESRPYLVVYEWKTRAELDRWQSGSMVVGKRDEYVNMWKVRNTRRAFELVQTVDLTS